MCPPAAARPDALQTPRPPPAGRDGDAPDLVLTGLCWLGLALLALHQFVQTLPPALSGLALALAYLAGGLPAARAALADLWHRRILDIDLLMVVAALAAAAVGAALEGAVLLALFSLSGTLEHRAMGRARRAVEALMQLRPDAALRLAPDGTAHEVPVADLAPGDRVILRPGARVPVDGRLAEGRGRSTNPPSPANPAPSPRNPAPPCTRPA